MPDAVPRIAAYFSSGPHYRKVLAGLRKRYPEVRLVAVIPPRYPVAEAAALADEVLVTEKDAYSPRRPSELLALVRWLRAQRFDVFVVMFPSPKLAAMARLSGARERYCHRIDGRFEALRMPLLRRAALLLARRIQGGLAYRRIRRTIVSQPVEGPAEKS